MADTIQLDVPKDAHVRSLCQKLHEMRLGLSNLGLQSHMLDDVAAKLKSQALEVERYRALEPYKAGREDGVRTALESGLVGDE